MARLPAPNLRLPGRASINFPRNGCWILLAGLLGLLAGAGLHSRLGCPAATACMCERRLHDRLDASKVVGDKGGSLPADTAAPQSAAAVASDKVQEPGSEQQPQADAAQQPEQQQQQQQATQQHSSAPLPHTAQQQEQEQQQQEKPKQPGEAQQAAQLQEQQQQPQLSQPATAAAWPPGEAANETFVFQPDGYELPEECVKHAPLYAGIFDQLRPWFPRGITKEDMDACPPPAPAGHDVSKGTPQTDSTDWEVRVMAESDARFRLLSWNNEVIVTSGGMERWEGHGQQGLHYYMVQQVQDAARRFGLPNIEFAVGFGDNNHARVERDGFPAAMCPLMTFAKHPTYYNLLLPSGEFVLRAYDEFVSKMLAEPGPAWEEREEQVYGRWSLFRTRKPHTDRWGHTLWDAREHYVNHSAATGHRFTNFSHSGGPGYLPLSQQRSFKYTFNTDGFTASTRLAKVLATGQTVIKQDSELIEFFYAGLKPWVHHVPSGWHGVGEIDHIVHFLRTHDRLARSVASNAQRFAATHLVTEGRLCYIKVLFEELAKLMQYTPRLDDFPTTIPWEEDVARFLINPDSLKIRPEQ